ncbi:MAG: hypothetical protein HOQ06_03265 [Pseudarthrobacter sp.]|nr:hypothetical protein [Pseudarthrobacter sp.]
MSRVHGAAGTRPGAEAALLKSARKRVKTLRDGTRVVEATIWRTVKAWAVDFGVVALLALAMAILVGNSPTGTPGAAAGAGAATWLVAPWLYGFCCARGRSLGSFATDTEVVQVGTGQPPGFWRAGWVMFARTVLFTVLVLVLLLGVAEGSSPSGAEPKSHHLTIDRGFPPLLPGAPPVAPYDAGKAD